MHLNTLSERIPMKILWRAPKLIVVVLSAVPVFVAFYSLGNARSTSAAGGGAWRTGMFGVAHGQTTRINALCLPPGPCRVDMMFLDSTGSVVSRWEHVQELRSGQATFFDHSFEIPVKQRVEIRAVGIISTQGDKPGGKDVLFSAEVFDNETDRTTFAPAFAECPCRDQ
jgi:hypothetical protein